MCVVSQAASAETSRPCRGQDLARIAPAAAAASKRSAAGASGRARQPRCEREGGDEGLANLRIAVAGFERGLFGIRIIPRRKVTALAAGQAHRPVPVPGPVARESDVDPHLLAGQDDDQVAVDIGQPALRDRAGRHTSVPLERRSTGHAVNTVNEPRPRFRPPLTKQPRQQGVLRRARPLPLVDDPFRRPRPRPAIRNGVDCVNDLAQRGIARQTRPGSEPGKQRPIHLPRLQRPIVVKPSGPRSSHRPDLPLVMRTPSAGIGRSLASWPDLMTLVRLEQRRFVCEAEAGAPVRAGSTIFRPQGFAALCLARAGSSRRASQGLAGDPFA